MSAIVSVDMDRLEEMLLHPTNSHEAETKDQLKWDAAIRWALGVIRYQAMLQEVEAAKSATPPSPESPA